MQIVVFLLWLAINLFKNYFLFLGQFLSIILLILGFLLLKYGADFLVDGASNLGLKFKIPSIVIGLTICAIGTSMPELLVSITSAMKMHSDLAFGNIIGSNIANVCLILGTCAIFFKPNVGKREIRFDIPLLIFLSIGLVVCIYFFGGNVSYIHAIFLILGAMLYTLYNIKVSIRHSKDQCDIMPNINVYKSIIYVILGIIFLRIGADTVCNSSIDIAKSLNISEKLISITIVSLATSLPELVTTVSACRKGQKQLAVGNVLGSNIYNILIGIGVSGAFSTIVYSRQFLLDFIILVTSSIYLLLASIKNKNYLSKFDGFIFILLYIIYMVISFIKG